MMSSGPAHVFIIWMVTKLMAHTPATRIIPYTSEFSYEPKHHPSENPSCPTITPHKIRESQGDKYFIPKTRKNGADDVRENGKSSVEIIAIILPCTRPPNGLINNSDYSRWHYHHKYSKIKRCHRKLAISIKLTNVGETDTDDRFIVIDHVTDPLTLRKSRLMDPYVIKIRQEQVLQLYPLRFQSVVNAEATEEVINNEKENFVGCDDYSNHPTCGEMFYKGIKIPHSQGFCCSCGPDSPFPIPWNSTMSTGGSEFSHKRFRDDTKSMVKPSEGVQSPRGPSTAKKYSRPVDPNEWSFIELKYPEVSIETPTNPSDPDFKMDNEIPKEVEQPLSGEIRGINPGKWSRNRLNRLRGMLMKSHVRNNENVRDSDRPPEPKHRVTTQGPPEEMTTPSTQKIPIITKNIETSVSLPAPSPRVIIDYFKVPPSPRKFSRQLLHYPPNKNKQIKKSGAPAPQDFAISLTGKIHVDGEENGPLSIAFDPSPGVDVGSDLKKGRRRSVDPDLPYEIIRAPDKVIRFEPVKNLVSNELPENDSNDLEVVTTAPDRIRPYALQEEPNPPFLISRQRPTEKVQPVNLKIIGLISMSNPPASGVQSSEGKKKERVGGLVQVEMENPSGSQSQGTTEAAGQCPFTSGTTTKMFPSSTNPSADSLETITFFVDDNEEPETCPFQGTPTETSPDEGSLLAVMDFIHEVKSILMGETHPEDPGTVVKLQKFVIIPEDNSTEGELLGKINTDNSSTPGPGPGFHAIVESPRETYIRIVDKPKNEGVQALESPRGELIDEHPERGYPGGRQGDEDTEENFHVDSSSLDSEDDFGNNRVSVRESGRKRRRRRKKKKKKKKKKWFKKWFKRELMSLDVQDVLDEIYDERDDDYRMKGKRRKREINTSGFQVRGGQNCMDPRHPENVNPAKYLESAHCLRFSDLWYSVYKLEAPVIEHAVYIQIFKRDNMEWRDLTRGEMIRLGTFTRHQRDKIPTITFTYSSKTSAAEFSLNSNTQRLLIPLENTDKKSDEKISEGMREYLIIPSSQITSEGRECDKAGVGFSAFVMQKDRCTRKRGSCLRNQPLEYWRHDVNAHRSGKPGCYFLSNFATVPVNPIKYNVTDATEEREYLGLVQNSHHVSTLEIEVRADDNNVITTGSARVTEVHVVAAGEKINLSIRLTNVGLVSSDYQARIVGCPEGLPNSWARAITGKHQVPPQHDSLLTLHLPGRIIIDKFQCNVEVINYRGELVAARRIIVHKMNRCFCLWHCICTCYESSGFSCSPMTPEHYHQAGFRGPVPTINSQTFQLSKMAIDILIIIIIIFLIFTTIGIIKWIIGILSPPIGRWGLDHLLAGLRTEEYFEPELKCRCVVTDDEGIPIHPDTGRRTVRICSRTLEFIVNSLFLFIYPCCVLSESISKMIKCKRSRISDDSKDCLIDKDEWRTISVRSYGDTRNSKLERDDTEYVITELKKSQVSLQDFSNKSKNKS